MSRKKYKRASTNMTVSIFYEQNCLLKFNYEPPYQRDYNVWDIKQKAFLIDTIFKNFPMPPIFLEQKIKDGKTTYDVIDGKQRLNTIIEFIDNKVQLTDDFGNDVYGNSKMNGKTFNIIKEMAPNDEDIADFIDSFWSYVINIEYIDKPDEKIVDNIFDRLNRGGERLNSAELRKAKYYDSLMYQGILEILKNSNTSCVVKHLDAVRMEDASFITELYLLVLTKNVISGVESDIDLVFKDKVDEIDKSTNNNLVQMANNVIKIFKNFELDLEKYKIEGKSHIYALLYLAFYFLENAILVDDLIKEKLNNFFIELRGSSKNEYVKKYSASMQSSSRSKSARKRRVDALLNYMGYQI